MDPRSHSSDSSRFYVPSSTVGSNGSAGYRSLSSDARRLLAAAAAQEVSVDLDSPSSLFCDGSDDDNLQVSSIDTLAPRSPDIAAAAAARNRSISRGQLQQTPSASRDTSVDFLDRADPFSSLSQFSLSTPDFARGSPPERHGRGGRAEGGGGRAQREASPSKAALHPVQSGSSTASGGTGSGGANSYSSLRSKIRSVQERYKKSAVSQKLKTKFVSSNGDGNKFVSHIEAAPVVAAGSEEDSSTGMSKFRSVSHGALNHMEKFEARQKQEELEQEEEEEELSSSAAAMAAEEKARKLLQQQQQQKKQPLQRLSTMTTKAQVEAVPANDSAKKERTESGSSSSSSDGGDPPTPRLAASASPSSTASSVIKKAKKNGNNSSSDRDSGILHEDSLSSGGSDSGFYHRGGEGGKPADRECCGDSGRANSSPRYSVCSSRASGRSGEGAKPGKSPPRRRTLLGGLLREKSAAGASSGKSGPPPSSSASVERRHSRASSVDRREIFRKYIQNVNEHAEDFRPYENVDPDLLLRDASSFGDEEEEEETETAVEDEEEDSSKLSSSPDGSPPPPALPPASRRKARPPVAPRPAMPAQHIVRQQKKSSASSSSSSSSGADRKEFRLVRLRNQFESDLGLFIARSPLEELGCPAYNVAYILPGGLVNRFAPHYESFKALANSFSSLGTGG